MSKMSELERLLRKMFSGATLTSEELEHLNVLVVAQPNEHARLYAALAPQYGFGGTRLYGGESSVF